MTEMNVYKRRDGFYIKNENNWRIKLSDNMFKKYNTTDVKVVIEKHYGKKARFK